MTGYKLSQVVKGKKVELLNVHADYFEEVGSYWGENQVNFYEREFWRDRLVAKAEFEGAYVVEEVIL